MLPLASVINPLESLGVSVEIDGADVIVTSASETSNIKYYISGSTSDGMFKIYSEKRFDLILNDVEITNNDGPAINVQSSKKISVYLDAGSENTLTDGASYTNGGEEDQEAAFFSEGQLVFYGTGTLTVNGQGEDKHAIRSDDYIEINDGNIIVISAEKDGIHGKDGFYMHGGNVDIAASGDGIDGGAGVVEITDGLLSINSSEDDVKAIKCDSTILISGGEANITLGGDVSKGLKSDQEMTLSGGVIVINTSGNVALEASGSGYDPSYCTAIACDSDITIDGSNIYITTDGEAGRGISGDASIYILGGIVDISSSGDGDTYTNEEGDTDAYHGTNIKADADLMITGGNIILYHSGDGGKGMATDQQLIIGSETTLPQLDITTTGNSITIDPGGPGPNNNGVYDEAKTVTTDGGITIESGIIHIDSADDGIKSKESITINGGEIYIDQSEESIESPNIVVNEGQIYYHADDDGFNATYGNGGEQNDGSLLQINGGYIYGTASGDAVDSNGDIEINGGVMVIHGPQNSPEVGMDVNGSCWTNEGFMVISGSNSNMTEGPSSSSDQYSVLFRTNQSQQSGTIFHIEDENGNNLLTFAPEKSYYSIIFSSEELSSGTTYKVYTGGTSTGTELNGLYTGGTYSGGTLETTFTQSSIAQTVWF